MLLLATVSLFPFLFLTLELPKRIINDAIGAGGNSVFVFGFEFTQIGFLVLLCVLFLVSVVIHGLLKMRINTMKGVVAERMLRRLRYQLVTRLFRFPKPYFQRTSQSEIVSMVTSEAEPLGGMMGDAISQPIMQLGQMLTILAFLFLQSFWFGLAAVSMIPLQAWLIPRLQKQINILNKKRIKEVRKLASEIGETAVGSNGGWLYCSARKWWVPVPCCAINASTWQAVFHSIGNLQEKVLYEVFEQLLIAAHAILLFLDRRVSGYHWERHNWCLGRCISRLQRPIQPLEGTVNVLHACP